MLKLALLLPLLLFFNDHHIPEPRLQWQGCNCNEMTLGLGDEDFMNLQVYIKSLEHQVAQCVTKY